jgi:hypothetical protein
MVQDTGPLPEGESTDEGSAGDRQTTEPVEEKTTPRTKRVGRSYRLGDRHLYPAQKTLPYTNVDAGANIHV